jgi:hypothetical protein
MQDQIRDSRGRWERQHTESTKAFAAFTLYRDMGLDRSLMKVAEQLGKSGTLMSRWSSQWEWVRRTAEYEDHVERQKRIRAERSLGDAKERHARIAQQLQSKLVERLISLDAADIPIPVLAQMLRVATDVELRALGDNVSTVRTEMSGPNGGPIEYEEGGMRAKLERYGDLIDSILQEKAAGESGGNGVAKSLYSPRSNGQAS